MMSESEPYNREERVEMLKRCLFDMQNAAIEIAKQLENYEGRDEMDQKSDFGPRTPIERIKMAHSIKRAEILSNDYDEVEWSEDIMPEQVGLKHVWADDNGNLWVMLKDGDKLRLKRLCQ